MSPDRKSGRNTDGTFAKGNKGKPKGARHKSTLAALSLIDGEAEALTRKAVELALAGEVTALKLCLDRLAPPRKDTPVQFELNEINSVKDAAGALSDVLSQVADGKITPMEAQSIFSLIEGYRKTVETVEFEERLAALEEHTK